VLSLFDDDIEWLSQGNSPINGTFHGKAEFLDMLKQLGEQSTSVATKEFFADGDVVVVLSEVTAGGQTGGEADVWTFRDGKITQARIFGDTAMMERVFGTK
jgi:uncharacterized protein